MDSVIQKNVEMFPLKKYVLKYPRATSSRLPRIAPTPAGIRASCSSTLLLQTTDTHFADCRTCHAASSPRARPHCLLAEGRPAAWSRLFAPLAKVAPLPALRGLLPPSVRLIPALVLRSAGLPASQNSQLSPKWSRDGVSTIAFDRSWIPSSPQMRFGLTM
jgi:hypothetical protein